MGEIPDHQRDPPIYPKDGFAIVGMSINVAGADDVEGFWRLMMEAKSQHVEVPPDRFTFKSTAWRPADPARRWYGNFIRDHDAFDHKFFKKSPREALYADPQQRLFLQCAYQAVEQSGYFHLRDPPKDVGVYVGVGSAEYEANFACHPTNAFSATGNLKSAIAGRVSHCFGWTGPGMAIDTACSASSVALHLACRAIADGDCSAALVGGTQMLTSPFHFQNLAGASFLSPTGPCRPFDVDADGYCRGEGVGAVFVKRMSDALAAGDYILGRVAGTAVLQNDSSTPMFVPNAGSLARLFEMVIRSAGLRPGDITAVEAHGTGTQRGDPAEMEGICRALGGAPDREGLLPVTSVKSVVGHTECASGMVSLIKVLLMLQKEVIPMQAGFRQINPMLKHSLEDRIEVPTKHRAWMVGYKAALINSFGASGSNSAMVITGVQSDSPSEAEIGGPHPFWIAAMDTRGLTAYAAKLADFVETSDASVADIAFSLWRQSNRNLQRSLVFQASDRSDLITKLRNYSGGKAGLSGGCVMSSRPVILCFGGQTSKIIGLSRKLFDTVALLRKHLDRCESILRSENCGSLYPAIFQQEPIDDAVQLQVALFAVQYACAQVWIDCGVRIAAIVGHSFGELTCLAISGTLTVEDAIRAVHARATLVRDSWGSDPGAMMAVEGELESVLSLFGEGPAGAGLDSASIACYNGPTAFTLAGSSTAIDTMAKRMSALPSIRGKRLSVSNAFHCSLVDPLLESLRRLTKDLVFHEPKIHWERATEERCVGEVGTDFFATHMRQPVHAHNAFERLHEQYPSAIWLEAGSNSTITKLARKALSAPKKSFFQAIDLTGDETAMENLVCVVETLWKEGLNIAHWTHHPFQRQASPVLLPPYQFEKSRHWLKWKDPESVVASEAAEQPSRPKAAPDSPCALVGYLDNNRQSACFQVNSAFPAFEKAASGYAVASGMSHCPLTLAMSVAVEACSIIRPEIVRSEVIHGNRNVKARAPLHLNTIRQIWLTLQYTGSHGDAAWQWVMYSTDSLCKDRIVHFEGELEISASGETVREIEMHRRLVRHDLFTRLYEDADADETIQGRSLYKVFAEVVEYSDAYRGLHKLVNKKEQCAGRIRMRREGSLKLDPFSSDCILQVSTYYLNCMTDRALSEIRVVAGFDKWVRLPDACHDMDTAGDRLEMDVYATHCRVGEGDCVADLFVFDHATNQLAEVIIGLRITSTSSAQKARGTPCPTSTLARDSETGTPPSSASTISAQSTSMASVGPLEPTEEARAAAGRHQNIAESVVQVLSSLSGVDEAEIAETVELADIGIDSLVEIELIGDLRRRFGCDMAKTQDWKDVITVIDLVHWVKSALERP